MPRPRTPRHALPARLPEALTRLDQQLGDRAVRLVATSVVGLILLSAGAASGVPTAARHSARAAAFSVVRTGEIAPRPITLAPVSHARGGRHVVAHATSHGVSAMRAKPARLAPVRRWLPSGTGMWLHDFAKSEHGNARAVVLRAQQAGLSTLYVQTGSGKKGWVGTPVLSALLPATRGTGIKVVAWDFPSLQHPVIDAMRLAAAARFRCAGCPRVAAVAPDIETSAEGTHITGPAIVRYYTVLRMYLPRDVAILATVPWPSEKRTGRYPYALTARFVDAIMPMAYWYNRSPAVVTLTSMRYLKQFKRPVMPIGQGYDGRLDAPYLPADPHPGLSVSSFLLAAHQAGARAVSLWSWQTTGAGQWSSLALGHRLFPQR